MFSIKHARAAHVLPDTGLIIVDKPAAAKGENPTLTGQGERATESP